MSCQAPEEAGDSVLFQLGCTLLCRPGHQQVAGVLRHKTRCGMTAKGWENQSNLNPSSTYRRQCCQGVHAVRQVAEGAHIAQQLAADGGLQGERTGVRLLCIFGRLGLEQTGTPQPSDPGQSLRMR